jgi:DNA-binding protein Fis
MQRAHQNQSKAALMLGMTRNTLRKKLIFHKLIPQD